MHNYKALKSASKVSVQKVKVVDFPADEDKGIQEQSHEELQVVKKIYSSDTGEAQDDSVKAYSLKEVKREIDRCKAQVVSIEASQAEWEQLETDLKAL
jgi:hypothetical protein